jgi:hypothetical protein
MRTFAYREEVCAALVSVLRTLPDVEASKSSVMFVREPEPSKA